MSGLACAEMGEQGANAMTGGKHSAVLDTIAVAHAAAGDFEKALQVISRESVLRLRAVMRQAPWRCESA